MKSFPNARRGRPNQESIARRIWEGQQSTSSGDHKCQQCGRTFPRRKSLIAHRRTHTGETPYKCTYPGCRSAFKQSGQLKTHIGRHTGALPFKCPNLGCSARFLHNNRECSVHKEKVKSDGKLVWSKIPKDLTPEQRAWIEQQRAKAEAQKGGGFRVPTTSSLQMPLQEMNCNFSMATEKDFGNLRHVKTNDKSFESDENHPDVNGSESDSLSYEEYGRLSSCSEEQNFPESSDTDSFTLSCSPEEKKNPDSSDMDSSDSFSPDEHSVAWTLVNFRYGVWKSDQAETSKIAESQNFVFDHNHYIRVNSDFRE